MSLLNYRASSVCEYETSMGRTCHEIYLRDPQNAKNGYYKIKLPGQLDPTIVECIFEDGRGWTVIQKRTSGKYFFYWIFLENYVEQNLCFCPRTIIILIQIGSLVKNINFVKNRSFGLK